MLSCGDIGLLVETFLISRARGGGIGLTIRDCAWDIDNTSGTYTVGLEVMLHGEVAL
jgi:hypothetical protein